jgi:hypothetical protein
MTEFEAISVSFYGRMKNGFRMSKDWNNLGEAIKDLTEMSKTITTVKK